MDDGRSQLSSITCVNKLWQNSFRSCPLPLSAVGNNSNSNNNGAYLPTEKRKASTDDPSSHLNSLTLVPGTHLNNNGSVLRSPKRPSLENGDPERCDSNEGVDPETEADPDPDPDPDPDLGDAFSCYLCTYCGKGCSTERDLLSHINSAHQEGEESSLGSVGGHQAHLDDGYCSPNEEKSHNGTPGSGYQYACKYCPRTFSSNSTLNVHYTHTHRDKPQYDCEVCGQGFSVKRELATHRRLHDGQPTHRCQQCGKEFGTKQLLRKHELWHTGERTHVCPQCSKAFFQKGHLTQHLMIHAGGRPHACHLCPKTFIFKFDLNRHMKIHAERVSSGNNDSAPGLGGDGSELTNGSHLPMTSSSAAASPTRTMDEASFSQLGAHLTAAHNFEGSASMTEFSPFIAMQMWRKNTFDYQQQHQQQQSSSLPLTPIFRRRSTNSREIRRLAGGGGANSPPIGGSISTLTTTKDATNGSADNKMDAGQGGRSQSLSGVQSSTTGGGEGFMNGRATPAPSDDAKMCSSGGGTGAGGGDEPSPSNSVSSFSHTEPEPTSCDQCMVYRVQLENSQRCVGELENLLMQRHREIEALQTKVQQIGQVAGYLVETCSDFDKMWILHNKKIQNQMQHVLNTFQ